MKSILLVDDETEICAELARTLRRFRFHVETASTLEKALRLIQRSQFGAVLLEFNLRSDRKAHPRTGAGLEVVRQFRALGMMMPVLIFTAMEGTLYEKASVEAGADGFILKSYGIPHVLKHLRAHIRRNEQESRRSAPRSNRNAPRPQKTERAPALPK